MTVIDMDVKRRRKKKKAAARNRSGTRKTSAIRKYSVQENAPASPEAFGADPSPAEPSGMPKLSLVKTEGESAGAGEPAVMNEKNAGTGEAARIPATESRKRKKEGSSHSPDIKKGNRQTGRRKKKRKKKPVSGSVSASKNEGSRGKGKRCAPGKRKAEEEYGYISGPFSFLHRDRRQVLREDEPRLKWGRHRNAWLIVLGILGGVLLLSAGVFFFILEHYHINKVYVEGNTHYTNEEIKQFVTGRRFGDNSLYLSYVYRQEDAQNIPFIEKMEVKVLAADSIKITVYEKAVAGYVAYLDHYMYFDKDGIIVESVDEPTGGAPQVIGLDFDHVLLHEKLPVEEDTVFAQILEVTQLMGKYEVPADKIYFNENSEMTLYFGQARVALGEMTGIDEKIMKLKSLLPELEGRRGVLQMGNYTEETKLITFVQD